MTLTISRLTDQLGVSQHKRHLLYLAATITTTLLIGYQFGTFDEAMHIPFLKDIANPALYPGDEMLALHNIYYSYFWLFFIPFLKLGWLEPVLFIVHISSIYLSYWAIWELSETLFHNRLTSLISVIAFIVPHFSFVGFPVFEFAPLSRTFVLPFLLIAMTQFFKGRVILAFLIAGLMYNIHVVSVNFILAMFGLACLLEFSRIGIRKIMPGLAIFIVGALPVLLWKMGGDPIDLSLRPDWVAFLNLTLFRHIFAMIGQYWGTWVIVFSGLSALALFFIAAPKARSFPTTNTARIFIYAGIIVLVVNVICVYWLPVTIIIQSQIARIGLWVLILAYLFFANLLAQLYSEKKLSSVAFWLLLTTFIISPLPILPLITWLFIRFVKNITVIKIAAVVVPVSILASFTIFMTLGFWHPGIFIYGEKTPWVNVQDWARINTPISARFITPPEKWGVQESDWRVHSERSSAITLSELLVAAFQPGYEVEWKPRFEELAPGALAKFNGDYFWNVEVTRQAYASLSTQQLLKAACREDVQYIVGEKPFQHPLPLAYENSAFVVYAVSKTDCK
ncbi:MAG: hypothetical protein NTW32_25040 [Chloroflexi bacterium]|nr:hypothetical protein [Chloroflexota bacterium]